MELSAPVSVDEGDQFQVSARWAVREDTVAWQWTVDQLRDGDGGDLATCEEDEVGLWCRTTDDGLLHIQATALDRMGRFLGEAQVEVEVRNQAPVTPYELSVIALERGQTETLTIALQDVPQDSPWATMLLGPAWCELPAAGTSAFLRCTTPLTGRHKRMVLLFGDEDGGRRLVPLRLHLYDEADEYYGDLEFGSCGYYYDEGGCGGGSPAWALLLLPLVLLELSRPGSRTS